MAPDDGSAEWAYAAVLALLPRLDPARLHALALYDVRAVQRARLAGEPWAWVPPPAPTTDDPLTAGATRQGEA